MNLVKELRQRRVPQYLSAYAVGCWGLLQFTAFLESRILFSPQVVNLLTLIVVCFVPSVAILAWKHGRPGPDRWGMTEKITLPSNVILTVVLSFVFFAGKDFGAMTETISIANEDGTVVERVIPKSEYSRHVFIHNMENEGSGDDAWVGEAFPMMLMADLQQDPFVIPNYPILQVGMMQKLGFAANAVLTTSKQRKIAHELMIEYFTAGSYRKTESGWQVELKLYDTETGRNIEVRSYEGSDLMALADEVSRQLRLDMGIPRGHVEEQIDLDIREVLSESEEAIQYYTKAAEQAYLNSDWDAAIASLEAAIEKDPEFAMAYYLLFAGYTYQGKLEQANAAMSECLNLSYRLPEIIQFAVKSVYYFSVKKDADRAMAVTEMWIRLFPNDLGAYSQKLRFCMLRKDQEGGIATMEKIVEIAPHQHRYIYQLATMYNGVQRYDDAEVLFKKYAELYPGKADSYVGLARLLRVQGRLDEAKTNLEQAHIIDPEDPDLMINIAMIDRRLGLFEDARKWCEDALKVANTSPDRQNVYEGFMSLHAAMGQMTKGVVVLEKWYEELKSRSTVDQANMQYGFEAVKFLTPDTLQIIDDRIQQTYSEMVELNQQFGVLNVALVAILKDDFVVAEQGIASSERFIEQYQYEAAREYVDLAKAKLAVRRNDYEQARIHLDALVEASPTNTTYLIALTRTLLELEEFSEANQHIKALQLLDPGRPAVRFLAMKHSFLKGKKDFPLEQLKAVIEVLKSADSSFWVRVESMKLANDLGLEI